MYHITSIQLKKQKVISILEAPSCARLGNLPTPRATLSGILFFFLNPYWSIIALQCCVKFLLYNKVNQLYVYIYPHIPSLLHLPPTLPIPPLQVVTNILNSNTIFSVACSLKKNYKQIYIVYTVLHMTFISQHMKIIKNMKFIYIFLLFVVHFLLFNIVFRWVHIPHFILLLMSIG